MTAGTVRPTDTAGVVEGDLDDAESLSRRKVFTMCSLGLLGAAGLAACGGGSSASTAAGDTGAAAPTGAAPASAASTGTAATGGAAASSGTVITKLSAVPVGGAAGFTVNGNQVIVSQPTAGEAVVLSAVCPHAGGIVAPSGKVLKCPLHGSTFVEATGANINGPAAGQPLKKLTSSVSEGNVLLQG